MISSPVAGVETPLIDAAITRDENRLVSRMFSPAARNAACISSTLIGWPPFTGFNLAGAAGAPPWAIAAAETKFAEVVCHVIEIVTACAGGETNGTTYVSG